MMLWLLLITWGELFVMDAVQVGSYAHRLHNYWTNLVPVSVLQAALLHTRLNPHAVLTDVLEPRRQPRPIHATEVYLSFQVNQPWHPRVALPTLVSYPNSHAFRREGPGLVLDQFTQQWVEPTAVEREQAMGFLPTATAAPKVLESKQCIALGKAMDMHAVTWLVSICLAF